MPALPVSFLVSRFPNPSETFIQAQAEGLIERGAKVEIHALAAGDPEALGALRLKWGDKLKVLYAPLPKTFGARLAAAPGALTRRNALATLDSGRFGEDASSLRLLIAAARWPQAPAEPRVWLAHYGRMGRASGRRRGVPRLRLRRGLAARRAAGARPRRADRVPVLRRAEVDRHGRPARRGAVSGGHRGPRAAAGAGLSPAAARAVGSAG
jgi:hypothetical protein